MNDRISAAQLAAAEAIFEAWYAASHPAMRTFERIQEWREEASKVGAIAVAAIDAEVWGEAEAARRALRALTEAAEIHTPFNLGELDMAIREARALVGSENRKADE